MINWRGITNVVIIILLSVIVILFIYFIVTNGLNYEIINSIIALCGLLIALITVITSNIIRVDPQRQILYESQLNAYKKIYCELLNISGEVVEILQKGDKEDKKFKLNRLKDRIYNCIREYWIILPNNIRQRIIDFNNSIEDIRKGLDQEELDNIVFNKLAYTNANTLGLLFDTMRASLGIEKLHTDTIKMFGEEKDYIKPLTIIEKEKRKRGIKK
jgi:hypothetical protein